MWIFHSNLALSEHALRAGSIYWVLETFCFSRSAYFYKAPPELCDRRLEGKQWRRHHVWPCHRNPTFLVILTSLHVNVWMILGELTPRTMLIHRIFEWKVKVCRTSWESGTPVQYKPQKMPKHGNCKLCYEQRVAHKTMFSAMHVRTTYVSQVRGTAFSRGVKPTRDNFFF